MIEITITVADERNGGFTSRSPAISTVAASLKHLRPLMSHLLVEAPHPIRTGMYTRSPASEITETEAFY